MNGALGLVARRLFWAVIIMVGVTSVCFAITTQLPGDPARVLSGPQASADDVERIRRLYGLDHSVAAQYMTFWGRLIHRAESSLEHSSCASLAGPLHVDLGFSFHHRKPVVEILIERAPRSFQLASAAIGFQILIGGVFGALAAAKKRSMIDEALMGVAFVGTSLPTFLIGLCLQYTFAYKLHLLPYDGYGRSTIERARSIVLPALTLGVFGTAVYARIVRDEVASTLSQNYVRVIRAKGVSFARMLIVHALRNALIPMAAMSLLDLGALIGGAVVTERLFRWPGVGQLFVDALLNRDGPVMVACVLLSSGAMVVATLVLDLASPLLDPRLRGRRPR